MTYSHVVIGARMWATHYCPMGLGAAHALYGFTRPTVTLWVDAHNEVYRAAPRRRLELLYEQAELDLVDNPLAYPSRHVVDP